MTGSQQHPRAVISIDAMGGDRGPAAVIGGMAKAARAEPTLHFIVHGPAGELTPLIAKYPALAGRYDLHHSDGAVSMNEKPSQAYRHARGTSMWSALDSVREREAPVAISCGNTGVLMLLSMRRLEMAPGVNRPAIAVLWPTRDPGRWNIMLDGGADKRAGEQDLLHYALMGAAYADCGLGVDRPRVGLLNVGTEEFKGRPELQAAHALIDRAAEANGFRSVGFVEGSDLPADKADVIVTDGFTGNVALKTAEGTAGLMRDLLREAFRHSPLSRLAALAAYTSLRRLSKRMDPRRMNGGVFLGLNGIVVKSHGASDATAFAAAIKLATPIAQAGLADKVAARIAAGGWTGEAGAGQPDPAASRREA
ncbi:MAG TPA: phosphate acyltransferase PlsX [Rhodobacteraceae bacterium]|jgi:glycerol-3-phosphate acyltransferase PlsX|nr:phosphate acyltransferase PlsX [Paracoccaceae bacterium]HBG99099.1 phosphate acyltransferase PlsX [Paracoccaceae bacterium]